MKRTLYNTVAALFLAGGMTACADFLEIEPQTEILEENFWNEKVDVENVVMGCYQAMQGDGVLRRMMIWGEFRSENVIVGANIHEDVSLDNILKENIKASNAYTYWGDFYSIINRCNLIIARAPGVSDRDPSYTESEMKATIAEVSALRDLCYFYLIRAFRDVPYSTEPYVSDDQYMTLPVTKFSDVLDALIADLENVKNDAVVKYPENRLYYQTGRITKEAIEAMLCEMYLWKKDYTNCIRYADAVINAKINQEKERIAEAGQSVSDAELKYRCNGFPLVSNFGTSDDYIYPMAYNAIFASGNSKESIFELNFEKGTENAPSNGAVNALYGNEKNVMGYARPSSIVTNDIESEIYDIYNNKYDVRYQEAVLYGTSSIGKYVPELMASFRTTGSSTASLRPLYIYPEGKNRSNWIVYRLTDIMLLKAEALVQMADVTDGTVNEKNDRIFNEVFTLVNAVNKRSMNQKELKDTLKFDDYNSKSAMEELVLKERQRELMFEGKRWFDLVRRSERDGNTEFLASTVTKKFSSTATLVQSKLVKMDAIYWPINTEELKVNPNLKQNPAYGSGDEEGNYSKTE